MSHPEHCDEYNDECARCQPALAGPDGKKVPNDHPMMAIVRAYWKTVPLELKQSCHRVWCFNSRDPLDLSRTACVGAGMEDALARGLGN